MWIRSQSDGRRSTTADSTQNHILSLCSQPHGGTFLLCHIMRHGNDEMTNNVSIFSVSLPIMHRWSFILFISFCSESLSFSLSSRSLFVSFLCVWECIFFCFGLIFIPLCVRLDVFWSAANLWPSEIFSLQIIITVCSLITQRRKETKLNSNRFLFFFLETQRNCKRCPGCSAQPRIYVEKTTFNQFAAVYKMSTNQCVLLSI